MPGLRRLYAPQRVAVQTDPGGAPAAVDGTTVESVREEWLVEDRWWTPEPVRRHYFELALRDGRALTVFRTARAQRWYRQRA
ncbi:MAG TPA: hypothetical protein VFU16_11335 [Solirubrobacterales bacterium]|nr:hypothetical protein [Solirubrobacterales bacterium]